ncbi:phosphonate C-P lyase system protein PhnH [Pseudaestuariivita rosea]|uniref:phosphonate C-P lyase system protein PhnH n=1 Tax=Pseudaestuariivita rosea TaxID=2763263 RepID=UPI001ABA336F|nr:phosphonate C-P lyase system protein PhnH [Pseudaestuariivita rosea]
MQTDVLDGGFSNPPIDAAHVFRGVMNAMARPGKIETIQGVVAPPAPLSPAAGAALLTLCDPDTPIHLAGSFDTTDLRTWISFHTGAPFAGPNDCVFALGHWDDLGPLSSYPIGTPAYPDRSATLIVETDNLTNDGQRLTGPGIKGAANLKLPETTAFQKNHAQFPLGLDFIFTCGDRLAALPRSTEVS